MLAKSTTISKAIVYKNDSILIYNHNRTKTLRATWSISDSNMKATELEKTIMDLDRKLYDHYVACELILSIDRFTHRCEENMKRLNILTQEFGEWITKLDKEGNPARDYRYETLLSEWIKSTKFNIKIDNSWVEYLNSLKPNLIPYMLNKKEFDNFTNALGIAKESMNKLLTNGRWTIEQFNKRDVKYSAQEFQNLIDKGEYIIPSPDATKKEDPKGIVQENKKILLPISDWKAKIRMS